LNKEITEIVSEIIVAEDRGDVNRARTLSNKKAELEQLRDQIEAGYNSVFSASIITTLFSYSKEDLDTSTEKLSSVMGKTLLTLKPAWALQDEAFISNMPYNENKMTTYHTFDRNSMGTVFPFFNSMVGHNTGIPLGFNLQTGLPIIYDNFSRQLTNYNMVIFGKSGAGKGVTIKVITARSYVLQGIETLALDVEGEYGVVAESLGGISIVISPTSKTVINIFDLETEIILDEITQKEKRVLNVESKVEDVTQAILTMAKGSTKSKEVNEITKQIISEVASEEYRALGINSNPSSLYENTNDKSIANNFLGSKKKKMPTLGSWYRRLQKTAEESTNDDYRFHFSYLLKVMKQYIREYGGQLAYFDGQSTFDLADHIPFINLDISQLEERFARPLAQQILLSWVWEKYVKKNSEDKKKANKKRVIVDEAWMLLPFPEAVDFLNTMARRARKRNVSLALVSQRFQDFYEMSAVQAVLTSSDTKLFLAQDNAEIDYIRETFKLSEGEASFLATCTVGKGLLKIGEDTTILSIEPTQMEFDFVDTNINTKVEREKAKNREKEEE
jgi:type IV secretory pathway virB4 components-like protein